MSNFMILEDEALVREHIAMELTRIFPDGKIRACKSVDELEKVIQDSSQLDLAICDINLGAGRSGIDGAKLIRKHTPSKIMFLTSYSDEETLTKLRPINPDGFITKPFSEEQFLVTVKTVLNRISPGPNSVLNGNTEALQETFGLLSKVAMDIQAKDKAKLTAEGIQRFQKAEKIFQKFNSDLSTSHYEDLLNSLWVSGLKLQKVNSTDLEDLIKRFTGLVSLALTQMKSISSRQL